MREHAGRPQFQNCMIRHSAYIVPVAVIGVFALSIPRLMALRGEKPRYEQSRFGMWAENLSLTDCII